MKRIICLALVVLPLVNRAQELLCTVEVNAEQIQGTETRIYKTLQQAIYVLMNNTRWTTEVFKTEERIECFILLTISEKTDNTNFTGSIQITSRRPVYKSGYYSPLFNHKDNDVSFSYIEYSPLEFNINSNLNNLTSILAFYAYMMIGLDYDSFELKGGAKYLDLAQKIVNNAQSANVEGWKPFQSDKNRYWMAENLNSDFYSPIRECIYNYHRNGLDIMYKDVEAGRKAITTALVGLEKVHQARPSTFGMRIFFNAKSKEIVSIYSEAPPPEKSQISRLCTTLDPGNAAKYDKITSRQ